MKKKNVFFFSSLLFILKNLFIEKIFKWLPKIVYWLADFKRKKYLGNTIKKNLRQYIAYNTATVNHLPLAGDLQVFLWVIILLN